MNCSETLEYLSAAVDRQLEEERRKEFDAHVLSCPSCRNEFEMEMMIKQIISKKLPLEKVPTQLRNEIFQGLTAKAPAEGAWRDRARPFFGNFLARPLVRPALVFTIIVLLTGVGITLLTRLGKGPFGPETAAADVVEQAVQHYSSYLRGSVKLQFISSDHDELRDYFQSRVKFDVYVPRLTDCELIGGVLCEHEGTAFLNLVYKKNQKIVYFYTACSKEIEAKGKIALSAKAKSDLKQSGWFFDTSREECNVAVWEVNDEICSVVADLGKEELIALLKE